MNVLVVDDERDLRELARIFLELRGHDAREAASGEEALAILDGYKPDAMLLDLRMEGIGGWGVITALQESGRLAELPVIIISAHADSSIATRAVELGCRGYLAKPFTGDDLQIALEAAVKG